MFLSWNNWITNPTLFHIFMLLLGDPANLVQSHFFFHEYFLNSWKLCFSIYACLSFPQILNSRLNKNNTSGFILIFFYLNLVPIIINTSRILSNFVQSIENYAYILTDDSFLFICFRCRRKIGNRSVLHMDSCFLHLKRLNSLCCVSLCVIRKWSARSDIIQVHLTNASCC